MSKVMRHRLFNVGKAVIGLSVSAGFLWLSTRGIEWKFVAENLKDVSISFLSMSIIIFMFASYLRAVRWWILFKCSGVSITRLFIIQNEGIGVNNLMPVRVVGEVVQVGILTKRDGVKASVALATLGMERVIDMIASSIMLTGSFFLVSELNQFTPYVLVAIGFVFGLVVLVKLIAWSGDVAAIVRRIAFLAAFTSSLEDIMRERFRLFASLVISLIYWILVGIVSWIVAEGLGISVSPIVATFAMVSTIFFATWIPSAPSAVGTFEFAVVYILEFFGIDRVSGFSYAVIVHIVFFLPPTVIAALFLPREGVFSFRFGLRR